MFERFTEKAIKVIMLAQEECHRLGHNRLGTEQLLLGLIGEGTGIAAKTLKSIGVNLKDARREVEAIIGRGTGFVAIEIPFTPRSKRVLELAWDEARQLKHNYIGTEHLLIGLVREGEGVAARVLENLGVDLSKVRGHVLRRMEEAGIPLGEAATTSSKASSSTAASAIDSHIPIRSFAPVVAPESILDALDFLNSLSFLLSTLHDAMNDKGGHKSISSPRENPSMRQEYKELEISLEHLSAQLRDSCHRLPTLIEEIRTKITRLLDFPEKPLDTAVYKSLTGSASKSMQLARQFARARGRELIGTGDLLLGLIVEGSGPGAKSLALGGAPLEACHKELNKLMAPKPPSQSVLGMTRRVERIIEKAWHEARRFEQRQVDTGHLLIAMLKESEGNGLKVLRQLGVETIGLAACAHHFSMTDLESPSK